METSIFEKLSKDKPVTVTGTPVLSDFFLKQGQLMKGKRLLQLYEDQIYYFDESNTQVPIGVVNINFDLRFEVIRDKIEKKEGSNQQVKLGKPKGIQLEKGYGSNYVFQELYSSEQNVVFKWRDALRNQINQTGFHDLFKAHQKIGKGNFASVYLAERLEDEKYFAVQAFSKETAYQADGKEAIINEINLMRILNHPNIVHLYEIFETENSLYLIIDLLDGGQLYDKVQNKYQFSVTETRIIMGGLISGLANMHEKRIMHRDLQPENIILRNQNSVEVVIVDLGLGTFADIPEYMYVRCGTPGYVAPQVVNIKDLKTTYDPVCDIYSAGLIFYLLLVGKPAFNGKTYNEILTMNRKADVRYEESDFKHIPHEALDLLKKMLQANPLKRISGQDALDHDFFLGDIKTPKIQSRTIQNVKNQIQETQQEFDDDDCDAPDDENAGIKINDGGIFDLSQKNNLLNSPALYAQDKLRKQSIAKDSCLDFQLARTPVITGKTDSVADTGHNSPNLVLQNKEGEQRVIKQMQSGFAAAGKSSPSDSNNSTSSGLAPKSPFNSGLNQSGNSTLKQAHLNSLFKQATHEEQGEEKKKDEEKDTKQTQPVQTSSIRKGLKNLE